jgi:hypothetical protein
LYGAAEFSRDIDLAIVASARNLTSLRAALGDLRADVIAVPPFDLAHLHRGHAIHFRCRHPDADGLRVDVMSRMRGVDAFAKLWTRRTTLELPDEPCEMLSLPDLVKAKKTQRDKDWPMIRRLMEAHYFQHREEPTTSRLRFWLKELRTPALIVEVARAHPAARRNVARSRPLLAFARGGHDAELEAGLVEEERLEREADRKYWEPLKAELEKLRHARA